MDTHACSSKLLWLLNEVTADSTRTQKPKDIRMKRVSFESQPATQMPAEDDNICTKSHCTSLEAISIWKATSKPINTKENNHKKPKSECCYPYIVQWLI